MTTSKPASAPFPMGTLEGLLIGAMPIQAGSSWDEANIDALEALNTGQPEPLAVLLAGCGSIHPEVRLLISEALKPKGKTIWNLQFIARPGRPAANDIEIGAAVIMLVRKDWQVEAAVAEVMRRTGFKRSTVYAAYSHFKKALKRIQSEADRP